MKNKVGQSQATKQLTEGPSITIQEMADSMGDRLREMVVKEKEKRQREKDLRSLETEKEGMRRKLERRLAEEDNYGNKCKTNKNLEQVEDTNVCLGPDNIPDATESVDHVITPGKDERTYLQGQNFRLEIGAPVSVVRQVMPTTPYKELAAAPSVPSEETDNEGGKKKRGLNIDDEIKLAFLSAWIRYSEVPFAYCLSENKGKKAKNSIENILK